MFKNSPAFSGFSVEDITAAKAFYEQTLGLPVKEEEWGLVLQLGNGTEVFIYGKPNHTPATFTVLNFPVPHIEQAVADLAQRGVPILQYDQADIKTDEQGICRGLAQNKGPDIAWFSDPSGNILSVLQTD